MKNIITIEYYSAEDCPKATPEENEKLEREITRFLDGLELFSRVGAGKKIPVSKMKRIFRKKRTKHIRKF